MKFIILSDNGKPYKKFSFNWLTVSLISLVTLGLMFLSMFYANKMIAKSQNVSITNYENTVLNRFDDLLIQATKLEAQVERLKALGRNLADKNNIDIQNYLLSEDPAMGGMGFNESNSGMNSSLSSSVISQGKLVENFDALEIELELQEQRFMVMKKVQNLSDSDKPNSLDQISSKKQLSPSSKVKNPSFSIPVKTGYISSSFGKRRDPINGHRRHHNGIDIAAKHGTKIHAIASGFVTFVGRKGGYGNVIDINHDESLRSRYAHLHKMNVRKGDVVRKGEVIASMGQTGRATGSHLHLEVSKNNKPINPTKFIDTALIK